MKSFDTRVYSISDFLEWRRSKLLDISPDFQRRGVWTRAAKSFLMDTIIRGMPMPKLLIMQSLQDHTRNVRTVVDGQQRLRTIFEFIGGDFTILNAHNEEFARKKFSDLPSERQNDILKYEVGVDVLFDVEYKDLLDIFARINTYSVILNEQEKLNAKYLGAFKTYAYELGRSYVNYFIRGGVMTNKQVSRMGEAQLSSDLLVVLCDGVQTINNIEKYYKKYENAEDVPQELADARINFRTIMSYIGAIYDTDDLGNTNWSRPPLFYSLFCAVGHALFGIYYFDAEGARVLLSSKQPLLTDQNVSKWRSALDEISARYDSYTADGVADVPPDYARFIDFARRRTTNTDARVERARFILDQIE